MDHAAEFAVGVSLCPADCAQTPDGVVNVLDPRRLVEGAAEVIGRLVA